MAEVDLIIQSLSNLPVEYKVVVSELREKLEDRAKPLDMEDVRLRLNSHYGRIMKNTESREEDIALTALKK